MKQESKMTKMAFGLNSKKLIKIVFFVGILLVLALPGTSRAGTLTNIVHFPIVVGNETTTNIVVTAYFRAVSLQIALLGSKSTADGHYSIAPEVLRNVEFKPFQTKVIPIDLTHSAFNGGYGAVRLMSLDSNGLPGTDMFHAWHVGAPLDLNLVTGDDKQGSAFMIPHVDAPPGIEQSVKIAIINLTSQSTVQIYNPDRTYDLTVEIGPLHVYLFDSEELGIDFSTGGQVSIAAYAIVSVVGLWERHNRLFRFYPNAAG